MVVLPKIIGLALGNRSDIFPFFLKFFKVIVENFEIGMIFFVIYKFTKFINDAIFSFEIVLFFLFNIFKKFGFVIFEDMEGIVEFLFNGSRFWRKIFFCAAFCDESFQLCFPVFF